MKTFNEIRGINVDKITGIDHYFVIEILGAQYGVQMR